MLQRGNVTFALWFHNLEIEKVVYLLDKNVETH